MHLKSSNLYYYRGAELVSSSFTEANILIKSLESFNLNIPMTESNSGTQRISSKDLNKELIEYMGNQSLKNFKTEYDFKYLDNSLKNKYDFAFEVFNIKLIARFKKYEFHLSKLMNESYKLGLTNLDILIDNIDNFKTTIEQLQRQHLQLTDILFDNSLYINLVELKLIIKDLHDSLQSTIIQKFRSINDKTYNIQVKKYKKEYKLLNEILESIDSNTPSKYYIGKNQPLILGENQFANWAVGKNDLDKFEKTHNFTQIDLIIYITATGNLSNMISSGTVNFDKVKQSIKESPHIKFPILLIGLDTI